MKRTVRMGKMRRGLHFPALGLDIVQRCTWIYQEAVRNKRHDGHDSEQLHERKWAKGGLLHIDVLTNGRSRRDMAFEFAVATYSSNRLDPNNGSTIVCIYTCNGLSDSLDPCSVAQPDQKTRVYWDKS